MGESFQLISFDKRCLSIHISWLHLPLHDNPFESRCAFRYLTNKIFRIIFRCIFMHFWIKSIQFRCIYCDQFRRHSDQFRYILTHPLVFSGRNLNCPLQGIMKGVSSISFCLKNITWRCRPLIFFFRSVASSHYTIQRGTIFSEDKSKYVSLVIWTLHSL